MNWGAMYCFENIKILTLILIFVSLLRYVRHLELLHGKLWCSLYCCINDEPLALLGCPYVLLCWIEKILVQVRNTLSMKDIFFMRKAMISLNVNEHIIKELVVFLSRPLLLRFYRRVSAQDMYNMQAYWHENMEHRVRNLSRRKLFRRYKVK